LDPVLIIGAYLCDKSLFSTGSESKDLFYEGKSDLVGVYRVFKEWEKAGTSGRSAQYQFCKTHSVSFEVLNGIRDFRQQMKGVLRQVGYLQHNVDMDANSSNMNVLKAVVTAGLYPNVALIKKPQQQYEQTSSGTLAVLPKPNEIKFFTKNEGRVFIHPSSMLFKECKYDEPLLVYGSMVSTSKVFLRDCTAASAVALLMMGGELELKHDGNTLVINNIRFRAFPRITGIPFNAVLINGARVLLDKLLEQKIHSPEKDVIDTEIGNVLMALLSS
jgi:ATP-dependent RNA helicase DHX57